MDIWVFCRRTGARSLLTHKAYEDLHSGIQKQRCSSRSIETDVIVHPGFTSFLFINSSSSPFASSLVFSCCDSWEVKSLEASEFLSVWYNSCMGTGAVWLCAYLYGNWLVSGDTQRSQHCYCSPRMEIPRLSFCLCVYPQKDK